MLSEVYFPGWQAEIDGRPAELLRADGTLPRAPPAGRLAQHHPQVAPGRAASWSRYLSGQLAGGARVVCLVEQVSSRIMNGTLRRLVSLGILLAAFGLRVYRLDYQELRGDEAFGYFFSTNPVAGILKMTVALREPHPIGSYVLEKGWAAVAGHSEFALRFLSAWFGLLAVALLYRLARRLKLSEPSSLLSAGLLALSPYALWHSQDARMYSMSLALTIASSWLALETVERPTWRRGLSYVAVTWLALNVHYFTSFVVLAQDAWVLGSLLADRSRRAVLWRWLELQALLALLYVPWLIVAGNVLTSYEGTGESPGLPQMVIRSLSAFAVGETLPTALRDIFAVVGTVLAGWGAVHHVREGRSGRAVLSFLLLCLLLPLGLSWIGALSRPIFNERYMIAAVPPFYLLIGAAFEGARAPTGPPRRLGRRARLLRSVLLGGLLVGMAVSLDHYYGDPAFSKTRGWRESPHRPSESWPTACRRARRAWSRTFPTPRYGTIIRTEPRM